jgi:hypothetical protein
VERPVRLVATLERMGYLREGCTIGGSGFSLGASFEYLLGIYALKESADARSPEEGRVYLKRSSSMGRTSSLALPSRLRYW